MTCTMPAAAVSSAKASVAAGRVNSIKPSACLSNGAASLTTLTPFEPRPASSPASRPITAESGASTAPTRAIPLVAAMAWINVRPMRPPAPAITTRISEFAAAMGLSSRAGYSGLGLCQQRGALFTSPQRERERAPSAASSRLRPVIAFDDEQIDDRVGLPHLDVGLIFRRAIAGQRRGIVGEFDDNIARPGGALRSFELAAADHEAAAEFLEDAGIGCGVRLVAFVVVHIDAPDPVALRHCCVLLRFSQIRIWGRRSLRR